MARRPDRRAAEMLRGLKGRIDKLEQANVSDRSGQSSEEFVVSPIVKVEDQLDGDESITISKSLEPGSDLIDDFEDGDMSEYAENTASAHIVEYPVHQGDFAVRMDSDSSGVEQPVTSTSGLPYYPSDGDTFRYRIYAPGTESFCRFYFGASDSDNAYRVDYDTSAGELVVAVIEAGSRTDLFTVALSATPTNEWVEVEIAWSSGGGFSAELFDASGTSLGSGSTTDTTYLSGGIGWGAGSAALNEQRSAYFDFARTTTSDNVIDDFEDENVSEYSGDTASATVKSSAAIPVEHGVYALELSGVATIRAVEGNLNNDATAGDTFESHHHLATGSVARFLFGLQDSSDHYFVEADEANNEWVLGKVEGGTESTLDSVTTGITVPSGEWLSFEVEWGSGGSMTATLFDAADSQVTQASATDSTWSSGGHGWTESGSVTSYHDYALVVPDGSQTTGGATGDVIDNFEDADIAEYAGDTADFSTQQNLVFEGDYALEGAVSGSGVARSITSNSGLSNYPEPGDTFQARLQYDATTDSQLRFNFATQDAPSGGFPNGYNVIIQTDTHDVVLEARGGGGQLASGSLGVAADNEWLRVEVDWTNTGDITVTVFDSAGTELVSITGTDTTFGSGGVGWSVYNADSSGITGYFDIAERTATSGDTGTIDSFEDNDMDEYTLHINNNGDVVTQSTTVWDGSYALRHDVNGLSGASTVSSQSTSGLPRYPNEGDTFEYRVRLSTTDDMTQLWFAIPDESDTPSDGYLLKVEKEGGNEFTLVSRGTGEVASDTTLNLPTDDWLRARVEWGDGGAFTCKLWNQAGTKLSEISGTEDSYGTGGLGQRSDTGGTGTDTSTYYDAIELNP